MKAGPKKIPAKQDGNPAEGPPGGYSHPQTGQGVPLPGHYQQDQQSCGHPPERHLDGDAGIESRKGGIGWPGLQSPIVQQGKEGVGEGFCGQRGQHQQKGHRQQELGYLWERSPRERLPCGGPSLDFGFRFQVGVSAHSEILACPSGTLFW
jgi:hypothetical protein